MIRRLGLFAGVIAASLAFAASAHANPTTPILKPIPTYVCGSTLNISWTPSTPDPGATLVQYRVDVGDLTAGTATWKWVSPAATSTTIGPLVNGHHYVVRIRALEWRNGALIWSNISARTFVRSCLFIPIEKLQQYVAYNPWPECIMCGLLDRSVIEDPEIYRMVATARPPVEEPIKGLQFEADGSVLVM